MAHPTTPPPMTSARTAGTRDITSPSSAAMTGSFGSGSDTRFGLLYRPIMGLATWIMSDSRSGIVEVPLWRDESLIRPGAVADQSGNDHIKLAIPVSRLDGAGYPLGCVRVKVVWGRTSGFTAAPRT